MKKILLLPAAVAAAVAGFFLRQHQMTAAFDDLHLPTGQNWLLLTVFCVVVLAAFLIVTRFLLQDTTAAYEDCFHADFLGVALNVVAGGLLVAGNVLPLLDGMEFIAPFDRILMILGAVSGLCCIGVTAAQFRGTKPTPWLYLLPVAQCILQLIVHFKGWSTDPIVLDYCFKLFAEMFLMIGLFYVAGFVFDKGKYRWSVFFCLGAVFFAGITLADGGLTHCLTVGGAALYLLSHGQMLLRAKEKAE